MKKVDLTGIGKFKVVETTKPQIKKDDDVLLRIDTIGICGSDIHYYKEGKIGDQLVDFPFTIGHECSAIVEEVGKKVAQVKPGDLVAIEPVISCHKCAQCLAGREHTCLNQTFLGAPGQLDGGLAGYLVMPQENCYPIPENLDAEMAMMVEPLSIGYYASQFVRNLDKINSVAILGVGPIGLGVMLSLQARGFKNIFVTDKLDYRLDAAKKNGAVWTGNPDKQEIVSELKKINPDQFDIVFECCGKQEALDQAIDILKPGGMLLIVGIPEEDRISFNISNIRRKEITIQNVRRQNKSFQPVIDLLSSGKISCDFMITHRFSFKKTGEAFDIVSNYQDNVIKALIKF